MRKTIRIEKVLRIMTAPGVARKGRIIAEIAPPDSALIAQLKNHQTDSCQNQQPRQEIFRRIEFEKPFFCFSLFVHFQIRLSFGFSELTSSNHCRIPSKKRRLSCCVTTFGINFFYGLGLKIYNLPSGKYGFGKSRILSEREMLENCLI